MPKELVFVCGKLQVRLPIGDQDDTEERTSQWIRQFEEWEKDCLDIAGKSMLSFDGKNMKVDWSVYNRLKRCGREYIDRCNQVLLGIGIFSFSPVGNWEIVGSGHMNLSPWSPGGSVLYFVREEDVVAYGRQEYKNAVYGWHIQQIARVINGN